MPSRTRLLLALLVTVLGTPAVAVPATAQPPVAVVVNELESDDPAGEDWLELHNTGDTTADLEGYQLRDESDDPGDETVLPAGTTIPAGGFLALDGDDVDFGFGLGNGDAVRLFAPDGTTLVDGVAYADHGPTSWGRCPDGTGPLVVTAAPSKGGPNDCLDPASAVRVNEVESADPADGPDWIELVNTGATTVDLTGYRITDSDTGRPDTIADTPEAQLAPGAFLTLTDGVEFDFGLGSDDAFRLVSPDGATVVDQHAWGAHADVTWGRCPDGVGAFTDTEAATQGTANACPDDPAAAVRINEVASNPDDLIELVNTGSTTVDLAGYVVKDDDDTRTDAIADTDDAVLAPGAYMVLAEGTDFDFGLGNGDSARLFAPDGVTLIDGHEYPAHAPTSWGRCPDGTGAFAATAAPTFGGPNSCADPAAAVVVNEVESSDPADGPDWIELRNTGDTTVDLSGYVLKDDDDARDDAIADGTTIAPGGFLTLDGDDIDFSFGLGGADAARLFAPDGTTLIDAHAWTAHAAVTYGRCPDGTGPFVDTDAATKGAANNCTPPPLDTSIRITEWMYSGSGPEFVELTNTGDDAVDLTGWTYDDDSASPAEGFDLGGFGVVEPAESVVFTEGDVVAFRTDWGLCGDVDVIGPYTNNLGRTDQINVFDAFGRPVDVLTYGDEAVGGPRTQGASGWTAEPSALGADDATRWQLAVDGDDEGSVTATGGDVGSPGASATHGTATPCTTDPDAPTVELDPAVLVGAVGDPTNPPATLTVDSPRPDVGPGDLAVVVTSSDQSVLPDAGIALTGAGTDRSLVLTPAGRGITTLTITVTDPEGRSAERVASYAASAPIPDPSGRYHHGISDASAALDVGDGLMLLVNDETNTIFLHDQDESGPPLRTWTFTDAQLGTDDELDLEGLARIGDVLLLTGSHGNNREGESRPERQTILGATITGSGASTDIAFLGRSTRLQHDLVAWDAADGHGLGAGALGFAAATAPGVEPNPPGGFNVEAIERAPDGALYLGFRAPTIGPDGRALLVPVTNPADLVAGSPSATPATFGDPVLLDLDGRSVRAMRANAHDEYLISAGPSPANPTWALYRWDGDPASAAVLDQALPDADLVTGGVWESIVAVPHPVVAGASVRLVTDSGDTDLYGIGQTKDLTPSLQKSYSQLFTLAGPAGPGPVDPGPDPSDPTDPPVDPGEGPDDDRILDLVDDEGDDPDPTAVSIAFSRALVPDGPSFAQAGAEALLASDVVFADALSSGTLQTGGRPLLLNAPDHLEPAVLAELERLGVTTVRILGGTVAIDQVVEDALTDEGFTVTRTSGTTRIETATAVAALAGTTDRALLARAFPSGDVDPTQAFADALAVGGLAAEDGTAVLLSEPDVLTPATGAFLEASPVLSVAAVGGVAALADAVLAAVEGRGIAGDRIAGADRFATAVAVAAARGFTDDAPARRVILVEGQADGAWAAGFAAAALSAATDAPIVLANGDDLPAATRDFLAAAVDPAAEGTVLTCAADQAACDAAAELLGLSTG